MEWVDGLMKSANGQKLDEIENPKNNVSKSSSILSISSCLGFNDKGDDKKEKAIQIHNEEDCVVSPMDATVLERARKACTLKHLNGASLIMYGLPSIHFVHDK